MSDRLSGNPHLADTPSRGLPVVAAPAPVSTEIEVEAPSPHPADVGRPGVGVRGSPGWSPTAWRAGRAS